MTEELRWRKSSFSGGGNDCVQVAFDGAWTLVRDSKHPDRGHVALTASQWRMLLDLAKRGDLGTWDNVNRA